MVKKSHLKRSLEFISRHKVLILITVIYCATVWHFDDVQQDRLYRLNLGRSQMESGHFEEAYQNINYYYEGRSKLFWKLSELYAPPMNRKQEIETDLQRCKEQIGET